MKKEIQRRFYSFQRTIKKRFKGFIWKFIKEYNRMNIKNEREMNEAKLFSMDVLKEKNEK